MRLLLRRSTLLIAVEGIFDPLKTLKTLYNKYPRVKVLFYLTIFVSSKMSHTHIVLRAYERTQQYVVKKLGLETISVNFGVRTI